MTTLLQDTLFLIMVLMVLIRVSEKIFKLAMMNEK